MTITKKKKTQKKKTQGEQDEEDFMGVARELGVGLREGRYSKFRFDFNGKRRTKSGRFPFNFGITFGDGEEREAAALHVNKDIE